MISKPRFLVLLFISSFCHGEIMFQLRQGQQLRDWEHLLSPTGVFKLGFFSPTASSYRYLGVWYSKLPHNPEAIWVGNPTNPILNSSGVLILDNDGRMKVTVNGGETIIVSSNPAGQGNVTVNLLDSGNLLLREGDGAGRVLWQSFDYPSNTLLPGMKLGFDLRTGRNWTVTSWLSNPDPAPGSFRLGVDRGETDQLVVWRRDEVYWTSGAWENGGFPTASELTAETDLFDFVFVSNGDGKYFSFSAKNNSTLSRWEVNLWGQIVQSILASDGQTWRYSTTSSCNPNGNYSSAICIDQKPSLCRNGSELFIPKRGYYNNADLLFSDNNSSLTISDCHSACWNNCSCVAFGSLFKDETGCEFWSGGATYEENDNFDILYVLALTNPIEQGTASSTDGVKKLWWVVLIVVVVVVVLLSYFTYLMIRRCRQKILEQNSQHSRTNSMMELKPKMSRRLSRANTRGLNQKNGVEFQLYSFSQVEVATDNFSQANKLGEGGFGPVYKGVLLDGQQIAVKRLARNSGQGVEEFMNEITLIADLQHTNLVKLFGCCIQGEEKMLIYEYMPNKSLDGFLFGKDPTNRKTLDWEKRLEIIEGIAQGLLYLHKYSRLKVIHRDLKASNILLDDEMNPKISDFGMARIFGQNESRANTNRIVGTYGYMSPEYAMKGIFSVKSDVFSFGVLMLEIVSGRKNTVFTSAPVPIGLIEQTWELWNRDEITRLLDSSLDMPPSPTNQLLLRVIHVSLLCVQGSPVDRPTMSEVISMIGNTNIVLPAPKQPAYCIGKYGTGESTSGGLYSINNVSITVMEAR